MNSDRMNDPLSQAIDGAVPPVHHTVDAVADLARRGAHALGDSAEAVRQRAALGWGSAREKALAASDSARHTIRDDPLKSVLIAAATGAALMALVHLMSRPRER